MVVPDYTIKLSVTDEQIDRVEELFKQLENAGILHKKQDVFWVFRMVLRSPIDGGKVWGKQIEHGMWYVTKEEAIMNAIDLYHISNTGFVLINSITNVHDDVMFSKREPINVREWIKDNPTSDKMYYYCKSVQRNMVACSKEEWVEDRLKKT